MTGFFAATYTLPLSQQERDVLALLHDSGGMTGPRLAALVLGDDGKAARRHIRVILSQCRAKLLGSGWTVSRSDGGRNGIGVYRIEGDTHEGS